MSVEPNITPVETEEESTPAEENNQAATQEDASARETDATATPIKALFAKIKTRKKKKEKVKKTVGQEIMSWVWTLLAALAIATLVRTFIAEPVRVDGNSMANTLQDGEIVLVSKMAYGKGTKGMERGDIVICQYPNRLSGYLHLGGGLSLKNNTIFVKRLVALPGDEVYITGGKLYVNGELVPDPELMASLPSNYGPIRLNVDSPYTKDCDEGEYFVIGDNRRTSHDSRAYDVGPIHRDMIMGKVVYVLFPFKDMRGVD